jgi:hypothetical protein
LVNVTVARGGYKFRGSGCQCQGPWTVTRRPGLDDPMIIVRVRQHGGPGCCPASCVKSTSRPGGLRRRRSPAVPGRKRPPGSSSFKFWRQPPECTTPVTEPRDHGRRRGVSLASDFVIPVTVTVTVRAMLCQWMSECVRVLLVTRTRMIIGKEARPDVMVVPARVPAAV